MAHAAGTEDLKIAERLRERAREYLVIAEGLEQGDGQSGGEDGPAREPPARPSRD
jgi:hypothetical protein